MCIGPEPCCSLEREKWTQSSNIRVSALSRNRTPGGSTATTKVTQDTALMSTQISLEYLILGSCQALPAPDRDHRSLLVGNVTSHTRSPSWSGFLFYSAWNLHHMSALRSRALSLHCLPNEVLHGICIELLSHEYSSESRGTREYTPSCRSQEHRKGFMNMP